MPQIPENTLERLVVAELAIWVGDYDFARQVLVSLPRRGYHRKPVILRKKAIDARAEKANSKGQGDSPKALELYVPTTIDEWASFSAEHRIRQLARIRPKGWSIKKLPELPYAGDSRSQVRLSLQRETRLRYSIRGFLTDVSEKHFEAVVARIGTSAQTRGESIEEPKQLGRKRRKKEVKACIPGIVWVERSGDTQAELRLTRPGVIEGEMVLDSQSSQESEPKHAVALLKQIQKRLEAL